MDEKKVKEVFQMIEEHFVNDYMRFGQVTYQRAKELTENIEIIKKIREIEKENLSK